MGWRRDRYAELRALLRGVHVADDVRVEFEHHLAERIAANEARGMGVQAAREDALRRFGDMERFRRETERIDASMEREARRMEVLSTLARELRQAARGLVRAPGFSVVATVTLALGIGASAAVYTLLYRVVLEPLPYPAAARLVQVDHSVPAAGEGETWGLSTASYFHYKQRSRALDALAVYWPNRANVRTGERALMADVVQVSADLFELLGVRAAAGRLLLRADDEPGATRVAVLDHGYWQREHGGDPAVIGTALELNGVPVEIVGVAEAGFGLPEQPADVYVARRISASGPHVNWHHLRAIGRMAPGVTLAGLETELAQLTAQLPEAFPEVYGGGFMDGGGFYVRVQALRTAIVGDVGRVLWIMLGSVLLVLLIACANVANLFLVRNEARQNELAIRSALGAARGHILIQALAEALLLVMVASALGVWLAHTGLRLAVALAPTTLPRVSDAGVSTATLVFVLALALVTAGALGVLPLLRRVRWSVLREGARGATASHRQLGARNVLVTAQIALAVVLLSAAGLLLRSFDQLRRVDTGIRADGVLAVSIFLPGARYSDGWDASVNFWRDLSERLANVPGVVHVGTTTTVPLDEGGVGCAALVNRPGGAEGGGVGCPPYSIVTPGYFEALGITVRGRTPNWEDVRNGTGAVVVGRALAQRIWPDANAIGRHVRVPNLPADEGNWYEIVGVAEDVRMEGAAEPPTQIVHYPIRPIEGAPLFAAQTAMVLLVRTTLADPLQLAPAVRRIVRDLEPAAALADVRTMEQIAARSMARTSFVLTLMGTAGGMALVLSIVGLYGVIAYSVGRRRDEIGIRMALGARAGSVGRMIMLEALRLGAIGTMLGLVGAALTTGLLRSLLFEVEPTDAPTLAAVALLLLLVAALASYLPARRAAHIDPVETLRG